MTTPAPPRTILHVDMDAFFVAVELRRRPELAGQPVVVGGSGARGVVAAASYEARRFGVHSAMPSLRARRLCPDAVFLRGDHRAYSDASREVHGVLGRYTPLIEPIGLDEAFLDVTGAGRLFGTGVSIARELRAVIERELALTCSVGVAPNRLLAKLASEAAKPRARVGGITPGRGVVVVEPGKELAFLHPHPVQALWGVGPATLARLQRLGITTVGDLAGFDHDVLVHAVGRAHGSHLYRLARADDTQPVVADRAPKSVSSEQTFPQDHHAVESLVAEVVRMADSVAARLRDHGLAGRVVTLKVRFASFRTITRSVTVPTPMDGGVEIGRVARDLLDSVDPSPGVRLVGVGVSGLAAHAARQLALDDVDDRAATGPQTWSDATRTIDDIRRRFGAEAIGPARLTVAGRLQPARRGDQQWGPEAGG